MKYAPTAMMEYIRTHAPHYALAVKPVKGARPAFILVTKEDVLKLACTNMFALGTDGVARYQSRGLSETRRDLAKAGVTPVMFVPCRAWQATDGLTAALDFERAVTEALKALGYNAEWVGLKTYFGGAREAARDVDTDIFGRVECKAHGGRLAKWIAADAEKAWY